MMKLPSDFNEAELELYNYFLNGFIGSVTTSNVYKLLDDPVDKFLVAYIFELGNTRITAGEALNLSKVTIWKRIKKIKDKVANHYNYSKV